jgi:hypothetical protein
MKVVSIPILFHTDETSSLDSIGVNYELTDCEEETVYFINSGVIVMPYYPENIVEEWTKIISQGETFITKLSPEDVVHRFSGEIE